MATVSSVDRTEEIQPRQPGIRPDTSEVGQDFLKREQNDSHSYSVRSSVPGANLVPRGRRYEVSFRDRSLSSEGAPDSYLFCSVPEPVPYWSRLTAAAWSI